MLRRHRTSAIPDNGTDPPADCRRLGVANGPARAPLLLLLLPERQQALRGGASDHGDSEGDLTQRCCRHAAERHRADADLPPEIRLRVRALRLELFESRNCVGSHRVKLNGVSLTRASPFGALTASYAVPVTKAAYDVVQPFNFTASPF